MIKMQDAHLKQTHTHTQFSPLYRGVPWSDTSEIMLSFSRSVDELSVL